MNILTKKKYNELLACAVKKARTEAKGKHLPTGSHSHLDYWRTLAERNAYQYYQGTPCRNKIELIKIAGMAYSWMPTMLDLYFEKDYDFRPMLKLIAKCRKQKIDWGEQMQLMAEMSLMINRSIVGASKVMHIIAPTFIPFTDSRVLRGWNVFFERDIRVGRIQGLPSSWSFSNERILFNKISSFTMYCDSIRQWSQQMNQTKSIRDIEVLFYFIGGKTRIDKLIVQ